MIARCAHLPDFLASIVAAMRRCRVRTIHKLAVGLSAVVICAAPRLAAAQTTVVVVVPEEHGPRFRFGVGLVSGIVEQDYFGSYDGLVTAFGLGLRLGAQVTDRFAVMYQGSVTFLWPQVRNAALFEFTPHDFFSVGVGPSLDFLAIPSGGGFGGSSSEQMWSVGIPVRLAANLPVARRRPSGRRYAISLSVDLTPGFIVADNITTNTSSFIFGVMGGVSFEMF